MDQDWFEMKKIRQRYLADAVWVPLRSSESIERVGRNGHLGYREEFFGLGSVAVPLTQRAEASKLGWMDIGIIHDQGILATTKFYKPVDIYQYIDGVDLGFELVLEQSFGGMAPREWHLNQDLVFALGLLREKDEWICPSENYTLVAKLRRDSTGRTVALEIKNSYLRDYLAARKMALRLTSYRKREIVVENADKIRWPNGRLAETVANDRFEGRVAEIVEGGHPVDAEYAVFHIGRTDVDPEDDVPKPGPETDANTKSKSWTGKHSGKKIKKISGEFWRNEWIEPGEASPLVRGDKVPTGIQYIVDASGTRMSSEALDDEAHPRWLWFQPEVIPALIRHRGGSLVWYTMETGGVACSKGYSPVHFGINRAELVTVLANDVAKLPSWHQQIWAGFNCAPEGKVSTELLMAQMEAEPAETSAPESVLADVLTEIDAAFVRRVGVPLFRSHSLAESVITSIHRFRAIMPGGVLALAKDLVRVTADRIDTSLLQGIVPLPKNVKWRSLKSFEKYLGTIVSEEQARKIMGPLVGAYELRLGDAHLPPEDLASAYNLVGIDPNRPKLRQGFVLIASVVTSLMQASDILNDDIASASE